jgi:hypothetical protein
MSASDLSSPRVFTGSAGIRSKATSVRGAGFSRLVRASPAGQFYSPPSNPARPGAESKGGRVAEREFVPGFNATVTGHSTGVR